MMFLRGCCVSYTQFTDAPNVTDVDDKIMAAALNAEQTCRNTPVCFTSANHVAPAVLGAHYQASDSAPRVPHSTVSALPSTSNRLPKQELTMWHQFFELCKTISIHRPPSPPCTDLPNRRMPLPIISARQNRLLCPGRPVQLAKCSDRMYGIGVSWRE